MHSGFSWPKETNVKQLLSYLSSQLNEEEPFYGIQKDQEQNRSGSFGHRITYCKTIVIYFEPRMKYSEPMAKLTGTSDEPCFYAIKTFVGKLQ